LLTGDLVVISTSSPQANGVPGDVYRYLGPSNTGVPIASGVTTSKQPCAHQGDVVQVSAGYDSAKGVVGNPYAYLGTSGTTVDLSHANYKDPLTWASLSGTIASGVTTPNSHQLNQGDVIQVSQGYNAANGVAGHSYVFEGTQRNQPRSRQYQLQGHRHLDRYRRHSNAVVNQSGVAPSNNQLLNRGDVVQVATGYNAAMGLAGHAYAYKGPNGSP